MLQSRAEDAEGHPNALPGAHLGITRSVDPRAIHREGVSLESGNGPSIRSMLGELQVPRWYLQGEESDPDPELQRDLAVMGVGWKVVPKTGHPMGLQNPEGFAQAVADALDESWPS